MSLAYTLAGRAVAEVAGGRKSLKNAVYGQCLAGPGKGRRAKDAPAGVVRQVLALSSETCRWQPVLDAVLVRVGSGKAGKRDGPGVEAAWELAKGAKDRWLLRVLMTECLFGRGAGKGGGKAKPGRAGISGGGAVARRVIEAAPALRSALEAEMASHGVSRADGLLAEGRRRREDEDALPRYARVNPAVWVGGARRAADEAVASHVAGSRGGGGAEAASGEAGDTGGAGPDGRSRKRGRDDGGGGAGADGRAGLSCEVDPVLHNFLAFPAGTDLHAHPMVVSGALALQDRASGLPALALVRSPGHADVWPPPPGREVTAVDACAAPGSKTSQLAAELSDAAACGWRFLQPGAGPKAGAAAAEPAGAALSAAPLSGVRVLAMERDGKRADVLSARMTSLRCDGVVTVRRGDFLRTDVAGLLGGRVDAVLLDPSCSGSGMAARRFELVAPAPAAAPGKRPRLEASADAAPRPPHAELHRVARLVKFQKEALERSLGLPGCRRVAYSTCSVWGDEDEGVVAHVLALPAVAGRWRLARALPEWPTRGKAWPGLSDDERGCLIRADPDADRTQGFFVALFERVPSAMDDA